MAVEHSWIDLEDNSGAIRRSQNIGSPAPSKSSMLKSRRVADVDELIAGKNSKVKQTKLE